MILIADNHELSICGWKNLIAQACSNDDLVIVRSKQALRDQLFEYPSASVIIDYTQLDFSSVDELINLSTRFPEVNWLLCSYEFSPRLLRRLVVNEETFGCILKEAPSEELLAALACFGEEGKYIAARLEPLLAASAWAAMNEPDDPLTQSEQEILRLIALGRSNKEIASERFSSIHTIATHRKNIFRKLQLNTAQEATKYALRAGLIELAEYVI